VGRRGKRTIESCSAARFGDGVDGNAVDDGPLASGKGVGIVGARERYADHGNVERE
jgi:hypothetical protein